MAHEHARAVQTRVHELIRVPAGDLRHAPHEQQAVYAEVVQNLGELQGMPEIVGQVPGFHDGAPVSARPIAVQTIANHGFRADQPLVELREERPDGQNSLFYQFLHVGLGAGTRLEVDVKNAGLAVEHIGDELRMLFGDAEQFIQGLDRPETV